MQSTEDRVVGPMDNKLVVDCTSDFTMYKFFESREALVHWVRNTAKGLGIVLVVKRSDSGEVGRAARLLLCCKRSGDYRDKLGKSYPGIDRNAVVQEESEKEKGKLTGMKKCGCKFALKGRQISHNGEWALEVVSGVHNHLCTKSILGHSYIGRRLTPDEETLVVDLSKSYSRPKDILYILKGRFPENTSTMKTIYNAHQKHRIVEHAARSQLQYLMTKLQEHRYLCHHRRCEKSDMVNEILFAYPKSVDLLRAFPGMLLMDCTYKTNRYKLPLLEIVGVTLIDMTFSVTCAYMEVDREENYVWALSILKLLFDQSPLPIVIVIDREIVLMNAIERVFPTTQHMLCRWHISKNILTNCKKMFRTKQLWDSFESPWNLLMLAPDVMTFNDWLTTFQKDYSHQPNAVTYTLNAWIEPYKERFVCC